MFKVIEHPADCEMRSVIRFLNARNIKPADIHRQLCEVYGDDAISDGMVRRWVRKFNEGASLCMTSSIPVGHLWSMTIWCVLSMKKFMRTGGSQFLRFPWIFHKCRGVFSTKLWQIDYDIENCAHDGYPRCSQRNTKTKRASSALSFLTRYSEQGDEFLDHIVTGDETWVSHMTPESKQQSMEWRHTASPRKKKFKQTMSTRKIMCTVFWDRKGVLLIEFLPRGETINRETYCQTLKKLRRAIQNKRRGMLTDRVVLLHDNVRPHTELVTPKISSRNLAGNKLTIPPTARIWLRVTFISSCTSRSSSVVNVLMATMKWKQQCGSGLHRRRANSTMRG